MYQLLWDKGNILLSLFILLRASNNHRISFCPIIIATFAMRFHIFIVSFIMGQLIVFLIFIVVTFAYAKVFDKNR